MWGSACARLGCCTFCPRAAERAAGALGRDGAVHAVPCRRRSLPAVLPSSYLNARHGAGTGAAAASPCARAPVRHAPAVLLCTARQGCVCAGARCRRGDGATQRAPPSMHAAMISLPGLAQPAAGCCACGMHKYLLARLQAGACGHHPSTCGQANPGIVDPSLRATGPCAHVMTRAVPSTSPTHRLCRRR